VVEDVVGEFYHGEKGQPRSFKRSPIFPMFSAPCGTRNKRCLGPTCGHHAGICGFATSLADRSPPLGDAVPTRTQSAMQGRAAACGQHVGSMWAACG
jgi:hypothetical protein